MAKLQCLDEEPSIMSNAQNINKHLRTKKCVKNRKKKYRHGRGKGLAVAEQRKQQKKR